MASPHPITLWGFSSLGLEILLEIQGSGNWSTTALANGTWALEIEPQSVKYRSC